MINNLDAEGVKEKIASETTANPAVKTIYECAATHHRSYDIEPRAGGLELTSTTPIKGHPNRCRLKVWQPEPSQLLAWFYKRSVVPHSRDRFSYGGIVWELATVDLSKVGMEVDSWLEWLDSGLNPEKRPPSWISAFSFDIPE